MNKTVLVTGASGDIGKAIVNKFKQSGCNVVAGYLNNKPTDFGSDVICACSDVGTYDGAKSLVDFAIKSFGRIDIVVNCAAISVCGLFQDITEKELDNIIDINIKGTYNVTKFAVANMLKNHSGTIINISSMWGQTGASCEVAYSMTKAAVIGFTKALAKELGPSGIRVNCVSPGLIDTKMNRVHEKDALLEIVEETPIMRMGTPKDVANCVYYLASDDASFVTGQVFGVNGGYLI